MKKFKFKLWPLLKIKEIEKLKLEQRMSKVIEEISKRESEIVFNKKDISNIIQSSNSRTSINLLFGQNMIGHRKKNMDVLKKEISVLGIEKNEILNLMVKIEREIDKLEEIKSEKIKIYHKDINKKEEDSIEEAFILSLKDEENNSGAL